ncbi:hypothetical protein B1759_07795 [Rubrivirga sp. SAORIC476]|uniref:hypothetical protein n=1 Tax=Rubrivirga sp. SAORIC476 TaxID=1961794 RepID=UPI000BA908D1|nr:hypothetical protein [Rubrivirga sp. SAORIC476]MBC15163.1 hypothetical protein [Rhodothermaceae bacterium]PAP81230.1 hypothetical protein B1759_07795 [Rubrivirga sp. SAORIC476]
MPVVTAIVALLVSVASFVFAVLVYADNRRLEREKHRAVALSATHTASLLLQEAMDVVRQADALFESAGIVLDEDAARRYADYRQSVEDDHTAVMKAMSDVAYGNLAVIEFRALAANSTLVVLRTIDNRKTLLSILTSLRASVVASTSDGGSTSTPPEWSAPRVGRGRTKR